MLTKFNSSNDMNTVASDAIHSYIEDGYHIDAKESVIDRDKDKDCTFKAVLKKDVDGIECKTTITLTDNGDDKNKACTYHKVETVGDTKWSEETRTFSSSTDKTKLNTPNFDKARKMWESDINDWRKQARYLSDAYNLGWDWLGKASVVDDVYNLLNSMSLDSLYSVRNALLNMDDKKASTDNKSNADKKDSKWKCKCPSAYQRLSDYIKLNTDDKDKSDKKDNDVKVKPAASNEKEHIKVEPTDTVDDIYKKIVAKNNEKIDDKQMDDIVDKVKASSATNKNVEDKLPKQDPDDSLEDSLIKLVRYLFSK